MAIYLALLYGVYVPDWEFIPVTSIDSSPGVLRVSILEHASSALLRVWAMSDLTMSQELYQNDAF